MYRVINLQVVVPLFFCDHRYLFKADGLCLNKSGVKLFISNVLYFLHHTSVPSAKDKRQSKQEEDITHKGEPRGEVPTPLQHTHQH